MEITEAILRPFKKSIGGAQLPHFKHTAEIESVIMPSPDKVVIPMLQHIGVPCVPCVGKGDKVFVGTKIGDSEKFISAPIHSSVSGTVTAIDKVMLPSGRFADAVVIESDGLDTPDPDLKPVEVKSREDLCGAARACGLVGLGGAGFPAHVKLTTREDVNIDTLIINAAECEPFITSDYRECMEQGENILEAVYLVKEIMGFKKVYICVEDNKPKAIEALYKIATDKRDADNSVQLIRLKSRYPQGAEKVLVYSATGRKVPLGKLPADVGCVVMNVTSISTLNKYIKTGMPLVSKTITVDGAVNKPQNVVVPIGTSIEKIIEFCGGYKGTPKKVLYGGPMMGTAVLSTDMPLLKQNNAILVFDEKMAKQQTETPCIRCGRCANACPMRIQPLEIEPALRAGNLEEVKALNVEYCMECGSCSYVCPAKRNLTQTMRIAKAELKANLTK